MSEVSVYLEQLAQGTDPSSRICCARSTRSCTAWPRSSVKDERVNHTLPPTALVNEAYLRLIRGRTVSWQGRAHFLNAAAQTMRRILIDHARATRSRKRAGSRQRVELAEEMTVTSSDPDLLLAIDQALTQMAEFDARKAQVVQLRYFGGLSVEETRW